MKSSRRFPLHGGPGYPIHPGQGRAPERQLGLGRSTNAAIPNEIKEKAMRSRTRKLAPLAVALVALPAAGPGRAQEKGKPGEEDAFKIGTPRPRASSAPPGQ